MSVRRFPQGRFMYAKDKVGIREVLVRFIAP